MAETALMAANRHRLRHLAKRGNKGASTTLWLLDRTDKLLSLILIVNTLINALATALVTAIAISMFGNEETVITIATAAVAFLLIVFAEISPKVIGATYPERIALPISFILKPLMTLAKPAIRQSVRIWLSAHTTHQSQRQRTRATTLTRGTALHRA